MNWIGTKGKKVYAIILCIAMCFVITSCAKDEAVKEFLTLSSDIKQLQNYISQKIAKEKILLSETNAKDLFDPNLLDQMQSQFDSVKQFSADIPQIASDTAAIKQQIQVLTTLKGKLQKQSDSLDNITSAIKASKQKLIDKIAADKETDIKQKIVSQDTHIITATDGNGNKVKVTMKIGKWIKSAEKDLIEAAWKNVGGTGSMPLVAKIYSDDTGYNNLYFNAANAAFVFGTVEIENITPDFPASNFNSPGGVDVCLWGSEISGKITAAGCQYSGTTKCKIKPFYFIEASMSSNKWGPVPYVIGIDNVFTPKFPEGDPLLDKHLFQIEVNRAITSGDTKFKTSKSW